MSDPSVPINSCNASSEDAIQAYRADGATVVRGIVPPEWIERMRGAIQRILEAPGEASLEYTPKGKAGRYYGDFFVWRRDADFRAFMMESPLSQLAAEVLGAREVRFFYDQLLVKEPNTEEETPWHQDLPYWPLRGEDIISIWVPFDKADKDSGVVHYIKGSHKWGRMFAPRSFSANSGFQQVYEKTGFEPLPDTATLLDGNEVLWWEMEPGDVLLHHPLTLHYAPGNSSATGRRRGLALRYVGDDAVFDARQGTFLENPRLKAILPEIPLSDGQPLSGELFPRVWPRT